MIINWNYKGAGSSDFFHKIKELFTYKPTILILIKPRIPSSRAGRIQRLGPFDGFATVGTVGFLGGIWFCWKADLIDVKVLSKNDQMLNLAIKMGLMVDWVLSVVYASPSAHIHEEFWRYICRLGGCITTPWLLFGDFNKVLDELEKNGRIM